VIEGLQRVGAIDDPMTLPPAVDPLAWHLGLLPVVENAVSQATGPFLMVVDEASALSGQRWDALAASIAQSLPPECQLVLAARVQAPPSLRPLRSSGRLVTLGPDVLALDAVEGDQILRSLGLELDHEAVLGLLEQTGGWPIALPLVASALLAGWRQPADMRLVTTEALADYLRHEVLEPLDDADARLLLRCEAIEQARERGLLPPR
jgi:ATP/maltotriose-dependent transcriptional regulator MalT